MSSKNCITLRTYELEYTEKNAKAIPILYFCSFTLQLLKISIIFSFISSILILNTSLLRGLPSQAHAIKINKLTNY